MPSPTTALKISRPFTSSPQEGDVHPQLLARQVEDPPYPLSHSGRDADRLLLVSVTAALGRCERRVRPQQEKLLRVAGVGEDRGSVGEGHVRVSGWEELKDVVLPGESAEESNSRRRTMLPPSWHLRKIGTDARVCGRPSAGPPSSWRR